MTGGLGRQSVRDQGVKEAVSVLGLKDLDRAKWQRIRPDGLDGTENKPLAREEAGGWTQLLESTYVGPVHGGTKRGCAPFEKRKQQARWDVMGQQDF